MEKIKKVYHVTYKENINIILFETNLTIIFNTPSIIFKVKLGKL